MQERRLSKSSSKPRAGPGRSSEEISSQDEVISDLISGRGCLGRSGQGCRQPSGEILFPTIEIDASTWGRSYLLSRLMEILSPVNFGARTWTLLALGRGSPSVPNGLWGHIRAAVKTSPPISSKMNEAFNFARIRTRFSSYSSWATFAHFSPVIM